MSRQPHDDARIEELRRQWAIDRAELRSLRATEAGRPCWCSPGIVCEECKKLESSP